jgi:hypothetical protein
MNRTVFCLISCLHASAHAPSLRVQRERSYTETINSKAMEFAKTASAQIAGLMTPGCHAAPGVFL